MEEGWLIETKNGPHVLWWNGQKPGFYQWTDYSLDAVRFARKEDADAVIIHLGLLEVHAIEHQWG